MTPTKDKTKTKAKSSTRKPVQATPNSWEAGNSDQEERVAHLIVQMQTYFDGLQAANRQVCGAAEPSEQVRKLLAAYEERHSKIAGANFPKIDIGRSLAASLAAVQERVENLCWPKDRVLPPTPAKKSY